MKGFRRIPHQVKEEILRKVKEEGLSSAEVAREHGVHARTVQGWLCKETTKSGVSWAEHNRLKRENKQLKEIVGHLTLDMKRTKKI